MLLCLPLLGYLLLSLIARWRGCCWRSALMAATVGWGIAVLIITEVLSRPPGRLTWSGLALGWMIVDLILLIYAIYLWRFARDARIGSPEEGETETDQRLSRFDRILLGGVLCIFLLTGITAIVAPPNNGDVISYHLPRIVLWLQNERASFYPTNDGRQLDQPPGAEYAVLQLHALSGGDRFDNLIQWFSFVLSAIFVSLIAARLGASRSTQILVVVFSATIPHAVYQATGGKNDCVVACLLAAFVFYLLEFKNHPTLANMLGIGGSLGLSILTKGTSYLLAAALLPLVLLIWPKTVWKRAVRYSAAGLALLILLNVVHWTRNYRLSGSPLGPGAVFSERFDIHPITPGVVFAGVLKNSAVHLRTPNVGLNHMIERVIARTAAFAGEDVNDRRANWGPDRFSIPFRPQSETYPSNLWHFLLIVVSLTLIFFFRPQRQVLALSAGLLVGFVLMSGVLRWQHGAGRFHIPLFVLWSVPVTLVLVRCVPRRVLTFTCLGLLAPALWWAIDNPRRSLLPRRENSIFERSRTELLFASRPDLREGCIAAAEAVKRLSCPEISFASAVNMFEYPMFTLLNAQNRATRIKYIGVVHPSLMYEKEATAVKPCVIICLKCSEQEDREYAAFADQTLRFEGGVAVFVPKKGNSP